MRVNMSEIRGFEYIEKMGLQKGHNAAKMSKAPFIEMGGDEDVINFALKNGAAYVKQYGKAFRIILYILKRDNTGYIIFNDDGGFSVAGLLELADMKDFAKENIDLADYILIAEVGNNLYTVISEQ